MYRSANSQAASGSAVFKDLQAQAEVVRGQFAALIGVHASEIAITSSTAAGINIVAKGLRWRQGDSVVMPSIEFPANVYAWMQLSARGVQVRRVEPRNGRIVVDDLLAACDKTTKVVAVSLVQFSNGFRVDVKRLGSVCRARGILLVVDGMQAVGAVSLDVHTLPIDAMALQSYKWLLGPHGVGWLYVRKDLLERIEPLAVGTRSVTKRTSWLDHRFELADNATRFETGVLNLHGIAAVGASIGLIASVGTRTIERRILALSERLTEGLLARGCAILGTGFQPTERSAIVAFRHPSMGNESCHDRLSQAGVITSLREGAIRASPHFYNNEEDIDRLLHALPRAA